jgi:hypothetical protein
MKHVFQANDVRAVYIKVINIVNISVCKAEKYILVDQCKWSQLSRFVIKINRLTVLGDA